MQSTRQKKASLQRLVRRATLTAIDIIILYCCSLFASYTVEGSLAFAVLHTGYIVAFIAIQIVLFSVFKIYSIRLLDSSLELVVRGVGSLFLSFLAILVALLLQTREFSFALRFATAYCSYSMLLLLGYRIIYRLAFSYHVHGVTKNGYPRTIVYGAGEIGMQLARQYYKKKLPFAICGFIDDDPVKHHAMVAGISVLGSLDDLSNVLKATQAEVVIIGITNLSSERMKYVLDIAERFGVEVKIVPSLFEMEHGRKSVADIRSINVDDLLGRRPIVFDHTPIKDMVAGKRVLVTGAGGSIGSEMARQLLSYQPKELLLLDIDETELHDLSLRLHNYQAEFTKDIMPIVCDVRDAKKVDAVFAQYKPEIVFHAAAYKHVPMMEYYPEEAVRTNVGGTYHVFSAAVRHGSSRCILISTDKAVNPTSVMGASKRVAEMVASMLSNEKTQIICVRFGNVLGSRGSMLPLFLEQIRLGLPITVTDKRIIRYFMTIPEAVSLVFLASTMGNGGEVMVLDMGEQVNIYEFAQRLAKYFGDGRSEVVISGLRPGEKLYEEKLSEKDRTLPTDNPKVFKAVVNGTLKKDEFAFLMQSINAMEPEQIVEMLRAFVPEYSYQGAVSMETEG